MKKKTLTTDEIFCGMPYLLEWFKAQERTVKKFGEGDRENPAVKELKEKTGKLLKTARQMDIEDLRVVYYVNNIKRLRPYRIVEILRKLSNTLEELSELSKGENYEK